MRAWTEVESGDEAVGPWVLVTDGGHGGTRDCVAAVRALAAAGYRPVVAVSRKTPLALPSRFASRLVPVPPAESPGFPEAVRRELGRAPYLTLLPVHEKVQLAMGPDLLGSDVIPLLDKPTLYETAERIGLPTPPWRFCTSHGEALRTASEFGYPVIAKPAIRRTGAVYAASPERLHPGLFATGPVVVQKYVFEELRAVAGVLWRNRLAAVGHERWLRVWPHRCGLAAAAVTTDPDPGLEQRLVTLLQGYEGPFCAQFAGSRLFDLNLRVHSTLPLHVAAGANLVGIYCDLLAGVPPPPEPRRPRVGVRYRWLEGDLRSLAAGAAGRETNLATATRHFLQLRPTAHGSESIRDPGPMASRVLMAAVRGSVRLLDRLRDRNRA